MLVSLPGKRGDEGERESWRMWIIYTCFSGSGWAELYLRVDDRRVVMLDSKLGVDLWAAKSPDPGVIPLCMSMRSRAVLILDDGESGEIEVAIVGEDVSV